MSKWETIKSSPKYPLDINKHGPHFLGLTNDGIIECWWAYPQKGSTAYAENHPPGIKMNDSAGCNYYPTHWIPIPQLPGVKKGGE